VITDEQRAELLASLRRQPPKVIVLHRYGADVARRVNLVSRGFAMEPEITTKLARMGVRIREHPITYRPRGKEEGKKIRPFDFVRYLAAMARFRMAT